MSLATRLTETNMSENAERDSEQKNSRNNHSFSRVLEQNLGIVDHIREHWSGYRHNSSQSLYS